MNTEIENSSGLGTRSIVPDEVRGWNWGAFLLNWIWGLGNSTYIALLMFVPFVGLVMIFVLGFKGSEWAWRNQKWKSIAAFKREQRIWGIVGGLLYVGGISFIFALFIFIASIMKGSDAYQVSLTKIKASPEVIEMFGEPLKTGFFVQGTVSVQNDTGFAEITYSIEGPKDIGTAHVEAFKEQGEWLFARIDVVSDSTRQTINLVK